MTAGCSASISSGEAVDNPYSSNEKIFILGTFGASVSSMCEDKDNLTCCYVQKVTDAN